MTTTTSAQTQMTVQRAQAQLERLAPLAYPLVRIAAGLMLVPHGAQKLFGWFGGHGRTGTA